MGSAVALLTATILAVPAPATPTTAEGFTPLFNGETLSGWHGYALHRNGMSPAKLGAMTADERDKHINEWTDEARQHWTVEDGELVNDGHGAYLATDKDYGDYELLIDYKTVARADSGIYLRGTPQVQIWDYTDKAKFNRGADKGSGGLWNNAAGAPGKDPLVLADKPFGEWNSFRIIHVGEYVTVYLNDKLVVDHARMHNYWNRQEPLLRTGPIVLQTHGGEIRWRNILIREIDSTEANKILSEKDSKGFKKIFNGEDFSGWDGPTANYQVKEGAILCQPGKGGTIFTRDEYDDFAVRFEYQLPPGGNNGLAIRYPGQGDSAYVGMCEVQILDDTAPKYAKLDKRQFNGSAYGIAACHRGFLRPTGEWNFMQVTVKGHQITVELNGNVITDADLSKVNEYMAGRPHPGKLRTSGHFGFCGHGDPVTFRNISIKSLDKE